MTREKALEFIAQSVKSDVDMAKVADAVKTLEQEPRKGHLVLLDECSNSGYYCSECQKKVAKEGWGDTVKKIKFCPNCGAKMVEPQESEDKDVKSFN